MTIHDLLIDPVTVAAITSALTTAAIFLLGKLKAYAAGTPNKLDDKVVDAIVDAVESVFEAKAKETKTDVVNPTT